MVENAKIEKLKCNILGDFQTLCKWVKRSPIRLRFTQTSWPVDQVEDEEHARKRH